MHMWWAQYYIIEPSSQYIIMRKRDSKPINIFITSYARRHFIVFARLALQNNFVWTFRMENKKSITTHTYTIWCAERENV